MNAMLKTSEFAASRSENDPRWAAIVARDKAADGTFFYSVKTTGVYCRPSCGSRRARPENVAFHATRAEAERAGFRPCKRCKPDEAALADQNAARITDICRFIENEDEIASLETLAARAGMSVYHFHRTFKAVTGVTPKAYANAHRAKRVRAELTRSSRVTDAIFNAGYNSNARFYENADALLGMTPTDFRDGGKNAQIHFAIGASSLGAILVARSQRGICAILLGDDPDSLARDLQDKFPQATLIGADVDFERLVARVVGLVEAPQRGLDLPLDVRGTAFQQRVWEALRKIPAGSTASYSEIAQAIGAPKSVRAVAQACAANSLAIAIPCHRVVRNDGALSGYRWGVERKRKLLDREAHA